MSSIQAERCSLLPFVNDRSLFLDCKEKDLTSHNMCPHVNRVMMPKISSLKGLKVWEGQGQKQHQGSWESAVTCCTHCEFWTCGKAQRACHGANVPNLLQRQSFNHLTLLCTGRKKCKKAPLLAVLIFEVYIFVCVRVRIDACTNTMRTPVKELFYITVITKYLVPQNLGRLICSITREFRTF